MYYLHIIDTHDNEGLVKSLFVEEKDCEKVAQIISNSEPDNIIIINSIEKDVETRKRYLVVKYVYINGNEDMEYNDSLLKIGKKNT